jgi:hypothetical protein
MNSPMKEGSKKRYDIEHHLSIVSNFPLITDRSLVSARIITNKRTKRVNQMRKSQLLLEPSMVNLQKYMRERNSDLVTFKSKTFLMDSIMEKSTIVLDESEDESSFETSSEFHQLLGKMRKMLKVE